MHAKSITASLAAVLVLATQVLADQVPYKLERAVRASADELFGLAPRQQDAGYQPSQTYCSGSGTTCDAVCGAGYVQCASGDGNIHCFNQTAGQICCSDNSGNSCDAGYYCTQDQKGGTWCCPNGMSTAQCAQAYSITGTLMSETALPTTSSTPSSSYNSTSISMTTSAPTSMSINSTSGSTGPTSTPSMVGANAATSLNSPAAAVIAIAGALFALIL